MSFPVKIRFFKREEKSEYYCKISDMDGDEDEEYLEQQAQQLNPSFNEPCKCYDYYLYVERLSSIDPNCLVGETLGPIPVIDIETLLKPLIGKPVPNEILKKIVSKLKKETIEDSSNSVADDKPAQSPAIPIPKPRFGS